MGAPQRIHHEETKNTKVFWGISSSPSFLRGGFSFFQGVVRDDLKAPLKTITQLPNLSHNSRRAAWEPAQILLDCLPAFPVRSVSEEGNPNRNFRERSKV
jgi:hypothetical protein